jgi:hypothetical protein
MAVCAATANGNASRLVRGENVGYISIGFGFAPINVCERLAGSIDHLEAARNLLNGLWCWEALHAALEPFSGS